MSKALTVEQPGTLLRPGENCWRIEQTARAAFIVDAAAYFRFARQAMLKAKHQIIIVGWDVDTRIELDEEDGSGAPVTLGPLLSWLAKRRPELRIHILVWDEGLLKVPGRGTTLFRLLRWKMSKQIQLKWDSVHPFGATHHQKILVVDDSVAFCGGIDITAERWDTRRHLDDEPGRKRPFTRRSYDPWHDATMAVDVDAAGALGDLARIRWRAAAGKTLPVPPRGNDAWPDRLTPSFKDLEIAVSRTRAKNAGFEEIREIEALFVAMIGAAERTVYVETQYFASRKIAEAITKRLQEPDGPEFVVINPRKASGWLDEAVMSPARYELMKAMEEQDRHKRFRIYTPVTDGGADIYVHAKLMFVDDRYMRVGSANMNNRSMGLDSECDLMIDGTDDPEVRATIAAIRADLLAEHLGKTPEEVAACFQEKKSLIGCIEALRGSGRTLLPFEPRKPTKVERKVAKKELLDPEGADDHLFEPRTRPGLLSRLRSGRRR
jgi:phospholipase D1/2